MFHLMKFVLRNEMIPHLALLVKRDIHSSIQRDLGRDLHELSIGGTLSLIPPHSWY